MNRPKSHTFKIGLRTRFGVFNLTSTIILAVITLGLGGIHRAEADIIISTPPGLTAGHSFRIAFVTDASTSANSTNIGAYNSFVNNEATAEAGGGSVTYGGVPLTFSAIGSTEAVSAISNIGQTGAPVYLVDGTMVADSDTTSVGGLWSGGLLHPLIEDLTGSARNASVWTGTEPDGHGYDPATLGEAVAAVYGESISPTSEWIDASLGGPTSLPGSFYGISSVLTVPGVPEPASIVLCLAAVGCGAVGVYMRRRRAD